MLGRFLSYRQREAVDRIWDLVHEIGLPRVTALEKICDGRSGSLGSLPMPVIRADGSPPASAHSSGH